jgi:ATP-dependent Clp protease, protease subunit
MAEIMTVKKIIMSGDIGYDVRPDRIERELDEAAGADIDAYLAGPGGYVSDGIEVFNLFRDYKRKHPQAQMMLTIRGLAASMDTYIAVNPAWDLIAAEDNVPFMIHNVWGGAVGDYREMRKTAEIFEGLTGIIARAYADKTKKPMKEIRKMMDDETWFFGEELLEAGFVDEIIKTEKPVDRAAIITEAKGRESMLAEKMAVKTDLQKVAALIKPVDIQEHRHNVEPSATTGTAQVKTDSHPAADNSAGKNTQEGKTMPNLQELLAQNPAAKIEYDAAMSAQFKAGEHAGRESLQATIKTAAKYLGVDGAYPGAIKSLAVDVLNGVKSAEALETTVAAFDAMRELKASEDAKTEQPGDTGGQQPPAEDDMQAQIKKDKAALGLKVEV